MDGTEHAAIGEPLVFERFVADLSSQFVNLPPERIDEAIRQALELLASQLGLDRCAFCRIAADGSLVNTVTSARAPGAGQLWTPTEEAFPGLISRVLRGEVISLSTLDDVPAPERDAYRAAGTRAIVVIPLLVDAHVAGALAVTAPIERPWPTDVMHRLTVVASVFSQVAARRLHDEALARATDEAHRLKNQLLVETVQLRREARERARSGRIIGQSLPVKRVLEQIEQVAATDSTVLLLGETGTGKELFASHIHELGARHARPMVRVNCAAIPATLIESELFGREKGAFTGALAQQVGRFEVANHSTIFLDEIGDLPLDVQVKLLRVLEERQIERLGSPRSIAVDVRIIAATHRNLEQRIADGTFREDLYYRLNVFPIHVPPLRERPSDIPQLVWSFVEEFSRSFGKRIDAIDKDTLTALQQYSWPGNVRELRNVVERAMIVATEPRLVIPVPQGSAAASRRSPKLLDVEKEHIRGILEMTGWRIRGAGGAADRLGLKPTTLETRMAKLGLRRPTPH